jgi:type VI protein secretion system component Hcp
VPVYMKYADVKGSVRAAGYVNWIKLESCGFAGSGRPTPSVSGRWSERQRGSAALQDLMATREQDTISPLLFQEALNGKPVDVEIDFVGGTPPARYLKFKLTGAMITSYSISGNGGEQAKPIETFTLNYQTVVWETDVHD